MHFQLPVTASDGSTHAVAASYELYPTDWPNCQFQSSVADSLVVIAAHEYAEAATDPNGPGCTNAGCDPFCTLFHGTSCPTSWGWTTQDPQFDPIEVADKCQGYNNDSSAAEPYVKDSSGRHFPIPRLWDQSATSPGTNGCVLMLGQDYSSPDGSAPFHQVHTVYGTFLTDYTNAANGASSTACSPGLGCPLNERYPITNGQEQDFQTGSIYLSSSSGSAYAVHGTLSSYYDSLGGPSGGLGFPTSDQQTVYASDGTTVIGQRNTFAGTSCGSASGSALYWSSATGVHKVQGCIYQKYLALGGAVSFGLPTQDEQAIGSSGYVSPLNGAGGCGGSGSTSAIYYSNALGAAHEVHGCIYQAYIAFGGPTSALGYPKTDEYGISGGRESDFQNGYIIYTSATGAVVHFYGSSNPSVPTGTTSCAAVNGPSLTSYCDVPTVTILCGGSIGSNNDYNGVPINWTYTNGSTPCDVVTYSFGYSNGRTTCSYYIYVPYGFATTTILATLSDGSQESMYEDPVSGWQQLPSWFDATGITSLTFTDANGTTNQDMGWGRASQHSIERLCSA